MKRVICVISLSALLAFVYGCAPFASGQNPVHGSLGDASSWESSGQNVPNPDFVFGINTHWATGSDLDMVVEAGAVWVRTGVGWDSVEPIFENPPRYNWEVADTIVRDCRARHLNILWTGAYAPSWATVDGTNIGPLKNDVARERWRLYVRELTLRYPDLRHFEVWNEPNNKRFYSGSVDQYVDDLLIPAAEEFHAAHPDNQIVGPSLAYLMGSARIKIDSFFRRLGERGAFAYIDIVSQNVYEDFPDEAISRFEEDNCSFEILGWCIEKKLDALYQIYGWNGFGLHPVWITETGWRSDKVGEQSQANRIVDMLNRVGRRSRLANVFIYDLRDDSRFEARWGILHADQSPKPSFYSLKDIFAKPY